MMKRKSDDTSFAKLQGQRIPALQQSHPQSLALPYLRMQRNGERLTHHLIWRSVNLAQ
jgi:hypothetical protein